MDRMFRVLAFWTGIFAVMFFAGDMMEAALLSLVQTAFFLTIGYLKLSERMYVYIFFCYPPLDNRIFLCFLIYAKKGFSLFSSSIVVGIPWPG
jgi:hypothetical protein